MSVAGSVAASAPLAASAGAGVPEATAEEIPESAAMSDAPLSCPECLVGMKVGLGVPGGGGGNGYGGRHRNGTRPTFVAFAVAAGLNSRSKVASAGRGGRGTDVVPA
jgi:hypothetical protein